MSSIEWDFKERDRIQKKIVYIFSDVKGNELKFFVCKNNRRYRKGTIRWNRVYKYIVMKQITNIYESVKRQRRIRRNMDKRWITREKER